jgi:hypothetical protein
MTDLVSQSAEVLGMMLASGGKELMEQAAKAAVDDVAAKAGHIYGRLRGRVGEQPDVAALRQALAAALREREVAEADLTALLAAYHRERPGQVQIDTRIGTINADRAVTSSVIYGSLNMGSGD